MSARFTKESLVAAVALLTAEAQGVDVDPADLLGDVTPDEATVALVKVASMLLDVLAGQPRTARGLQVAGLVFAEEHPDH